MPVCSREPTFDGHAREPPPEDPRRRRWCLRPRDGSGAAVARTGLVRHRRARAGAPLRSPAAHDRRAVRADQADSHRALRDRRGPRLRPDSRRPGSRRRRRPPSGHPGREPDGLRRARSRARRTAGGGRPRCASVSRLAGRGRRRRRAGEDRPGPYPRRVRRSLGRHVDASAVRARAADRGLGEGARRRRRRPARDRRARAPRGVRIPCESGRSPTSCGPAACVSSRAPRSTASRTAVCASDQKARSVWTSPLPFPSCSGRRCPGCRMTSEDSPRSTSGAGSADSTTSTPSAT